MGYLSVSALSLSYRNKIIFEFKGKKKMQWLEKPADTNISNESPFSNGMA